MSTVDNTPTEFSDDPNLLNVAISRAKKHLCIVTNGNDMPQDTNLAQLIAYIQYNNFGVKESKLHSVFDLLYKQYTAERLAYEQAHPVVSGYLSENLMFDMLVKGIAKSELANTEVLCHYPLSRLIADWDVLDEQGYAHTLVNRVGHGIGYSVHEGPYINQINHRHLERGMCFSIEPGVYLGGRFGMRVENIVCINERGETEILNKADRSLRVLDWYKK